MASQVRKMAKRVLANVWSRGGSGGARARAIVAHPLVNGAPNIMLVRDPAVDHPKRVSIARRLIAAYELAKADEPAAKLQLPKDDLWTNLVDSNFKELLQILNERDAQALSNYLLHFGEKYTWFGGLTLTVDGFNRRQKRPSSIALTYLDKLVCLAESVGVLSLENPEQSGHWGRNLYVEVDEILDAIEKEIGISVAPPSGAVPIEGIQTSRGPLHYRHFNAIYAALRIKALLQNGGSISEYGGGLGLVAYYANRLGYSNYTVYDLPLVNVFAGHYLMNTLGSEALGLYGEESESPSINILPYWKCMDAESGTYALSINQDSFPEIDPSLVQDYLQQIKRTTTNYFLSINQEAQAPMGSRSQNSVPTLIGDINEFRRMYRMKYWIREGYVEELYELGI